MSASIPRTIAEYLSQLRAALRGADPALIQDALYDAEEHLRGEMHDNPGKSEAEVLANIVGSYGAPEEVAGIYIDKEAQVQQALRPPPPRSPSPQSAWGRFFAVGSDARAYAGLFYMLLSLLTGIFYFTWTVVGVTLSLGLSSLIFGVVFAVLFFATTRVLALVESRIVETMLGERMPRRPVYAREGLTLRQRIVEMFTDPHTWTTLLYFVLMLPLGIVYFTIAVAGIAASLGCIVASVAHIGWRLLGLIRIGAAADGRFSDTMLVPWQIADPIVFVLGVALLFGLLHFARGMTKFQGALAKSLLVESAA